MSQRSAGEGPQPAVFGRFERVAVLGAGVMGAQIAAHLVNAGVPCVLFDMPAREGSDKLATVRKAIAGLLKLQPSPLGHKDLADLIVPAQYDDDLGKLSGCDLIIEAIAEKMEWKRDLYAKIAPYLQRSSSSKANGAPLRDVVLASNTSGLSLNALADVLPEDLRSRFCGVHFFNPPRYMRLVELIPCRATDPQILDELETFATLALGKNVVRAKDTPSFIANRIGVFSMLSTMKRAEQFALPFDVVDALTGPLIGRAKSATYRTADVVGLDTLCHVVATMADQLKQDPWHGLYAPPPWLKQLVAQGALGQKAGAGIYKKGGKGGKEIQVLDLTTANYRPSAGVLSDEIQKLMKTKSSAERFAQLRQHPSAEAQFLWAIFSDVFHYCAVLLAECAESARDIDWCMRHGYGWAQGPFEVWQDAGWQQIVRWVQDDISSGKALCSAPLPAWALEPSRQGVHGDAGSYAPAKGSMVPRSNLSVYKRQHFPESLLGESVTYGTTLFENAGVRLWTTGDNVGILSFKSKMHAVGDAVLQGCFEAVERARRDLRGLVIWQTEQPFCAGANLQELAEAAAAKKLDLVSNMVRRFQQTSQMFKYAPVPVVAAPSGLALGGGCEFLMHTDRVVAHLETYAGLVEVGVGLLPAGGGCKEFAVRAARRAGPGGLVAELKAGFENMAMAKVSTSALDAKALGLLRDADLVIMHPDELLHVAKAQIVSLSEAGYRPPIASALFPVAGRPGIATLQMVLVNMLEGHFISEHDANIGRRMATVLCGGEVDEGTLVDEDWILKLEHDHFMELCATEKTQERVVHMLKTGKPLRN